MSLPLPHPWIALGRWKDLLGMWPLALAESFVFYARSISSRYNASLGRIVNHSLCLFIFQKWGFACVTHGIGMCLALAVHLLSQFPCDPSSSNTFSLGDFPLSKNLFCNPKVTSGMCECAFGRSGRKSKGRFVILCGCLFIYFLESPCMFTSGNIWRESLGWACGVETKPSLLPRGLPYANPSWKSPQSSLGTISLCKSILGLQTHDTWHL